MSTLTKLLPANAAPAQTLLDKAHALPLTSAQRAELPQVIHTPEGEVELGVPADQLRPVEVNDVFVDEKGGFWAVRPAVEKVLNVTGDVNVLREAAGALVRVGLLLSGDASARRPCSGHAVKESGGRDAQSYRSGERGMELWRGEYGYAGKIHPLP